MTDTTVALKSRISSEMKTSMKEKNKVRLGVIRLMMAAIKQREVDERIELDDSQIQLVLGKMIKQGRESVKQYRSGGRDDLAQTEEAEISVIQEFLPEALGMDVINEIIKSVMEQTGATSIKDMGKVMATLKPKIQGRADMAEVSARVKTLLVSF